MTSLIALTLTFAFAYGLVESGLALAGSSKLGRGLVLTLALVTGFAIPWGIVGCVAGMVTGRDGEDD